MGYSIRHSQAYLLAMRNQVRGISSSVGAPSAPGGVQQNFPTSAYGQTIPVLYGKARVPGAYVWAPDIEVTTSSTTYRIAFQGDVTETSVSRKINCRVRFGAPLVPESEWTLRRLWADGRKIYDASTGYRWGGLRFRFYDGQSTQDRDPTMVDEEGEDNVSAHRGYIDIVIRDFDIGEASSPPVFEAEVVQGAVTALDRDNFTTFFADAVNTVPAPDWEDGTFYGYSETPNLIRKFSIGDLREVYAVPLTGLVGANGLRENSFRYFPRLDRLLAVANLPGGAYPILINAATGAAEAESVAPVGDPGQSVNADAAFLIGDKGVMVVASIHIGYLSTFKFTASTIERVTLSASSWDARGVPECITVGDIGSSSAVVWICAGTTLYKCTVTINGLITSVSSHATFADDLRYAVWYDDDVIVWTDNAQAIRVNGTTGATVWTQSVPYQIGAAFSRGPASPDQNRVDKNFIYEETAAFNFTNLDTGVTTSIAHAASGTFRRAFDSEANWQVTTDNATAPVRTVFDAVGDGEERPLEDFLVDLFVHGGGFSEDQVQVIGIDDLIQGAVIDITQSVREVARSIAEPYSFAIFERAGKIIFKRAGTD